MLGAVERLAATGQLIAGRMPAVFLNLRRNTRTWTTAPFPRPAERRTFGRGPAVFQYVPGHGMQLHLLATWGGSTRGLRRCLAARGAGAQARARRARRARAARRRRAAASSRGSTTTPTRRARRRGSAGWRRPPRSRRSRAARGCSRKPRYRRLARRALGAFETPPPAGVAVPPRAAARYVMYSFAPTLRILNGELQAINGLRDAAVLGRESRAPRGSCAPATWRRGRRSAASTPARGRSTRRRARSRRSPTTSSRRASSTSSAAAPSDAPTATPRGASRATSTSRRGSASRRCRGCGRAARRRCGSRSRRARRSRSGFGPRGS